MACKSVGSSGRDPLPQRIAFSKKLDTTIEQLVDRVVETDSPTLVKTYESRIRKLEAEKAETAEMVASCGRPLKSFDDTFRTAMSFLANPCNLWEVTASKTSGRC